MKWTKRTDNISNVGGGYECGEYIIKETFDSYNLQNKYGGKRNNYYWVLIKGDEVIKYASTAKALKTYAETI